MNTLSASQQKAVNEDTQMHNPYKSRYEVPHANVRKQGKGGCLLWGFAILLVVFVISMIAGSEGGNISKNRTSSISSSAQSSKPERWAVLGCKHYIKTPDFHIGSQYEYHYKNMRHADALEWCRANVDSLSPSDISYFQQLGMSEYGR